MSYWFSCVLHENQTLQRHFRIDYAAAKCDSEYESDEELAELFQCYGLKHSACLLTSDVKEDDVKILPEDGEEEEEQVDCENWYSNLGNVIEVGFEEGKNWNVSDGGGRGDGGDRVEGVNGGGGMVATVKAF